MSMEELAKGLFGGKLLQGAFPHTQEDAYIRKTVDEETENPQTPDGNKDRPDAYRRDFNDPDEESPETEDREEAGADEDNGEESPEPEETQAATPETPESPTTPAETPEMAEELETPEQTIEATPEPETPEQEESASTRRTFTEADVRERGRQAIEEARARLAARDGSDEGGEVDMADAEGADAEIVTPDMATPEGEDLVEEPVDSREGKPLPSEGNTTIGNFLISTIHAGFTIAADRAFGAGKLTQEERIALSNAISEALDAFSNALDEEHADIRDREMPSALAVLAH